MRAFKMKGMHEMKAFKTERTLLWNGEQHEVKYPMRKLRARVNDPYTYAIERPCGTDAVFAKIYFGDESITETNPVDTNIEVWNRRGEVTIRCTNENCDIHTMAIHHMALGWAMLLASEYEKGNETT